MRQHTEAIYRRCEGTTRTRFQIAHHGAEKVNVTALSLLRYFHCPVTSPRLEWCLKFELNCVELEKGEKAFCAMALIPQIKFLDFKRGCESCVTRKSEYDVEALVHEAKWIG